MGIVAGDVVVRLCDRNWRESLVRVSPPRASPRAVPFEVIIAEAARLVASGDVSKAGAIVDAALSAAPLGNAGWIVPIEPLLMVSQAPDVWGAVLTQLRVRAK